MYIVFGLLFVIIFLLVFERIQVNSNVGKLRIRIHVNGTRGKSTVAKYMGILLRTNNIRAYSKVTGVVPTLYDNIGNKKILKRIGPARVTEQFKIIRRAVGNKAEALVLECMSINPELQNLESTTFKPHLYVITNIFEDHLEATEEQADIRVKAFCEAIPSDSIVISAERKYRDSLENQSEKMGNRFVHVDDYRFTESIPDLSEIVVDNIKITLVAASLLNLNSDMFLEDVGNSTGDKLVCESTINGYKFNFINGFAVNDISSADLLLNNLKQHLYTNRIVILNTRADRPHRSKLFVNWLTKLNGISSIILTGDHISYSYRELYKNGVDNSKIITWSRSISKSARQELSNLVNSDTSVIGIGNIRNDGFDIINSLA